VEHRLIQQLAQALVEDEDGFVYGDRPRIVC
jgi:hypothetical protein